MKLLFITAPFVGHLFPTIPIAEKALERGHEVMYGTGTFYKKLLEREKFKYTSIGCSGDISKPDTKYVTLMNTRMSEKEEKKMHEQWVGRVKQNAWDVLNAIDAFKPDGILLEASFLGAEIACSLSKVPFATISMYPGQLGSTPEYYYTGLGLPYDGKDKTKNQSKEIVKEIRKRKQESNDRYNDIRSLFGLKEVENPMVFGPLSDNLILLPTANELEYNRNDYDKRYHFIGPSLWYKGKEYKPELSDKIMEVVKERARGRKVVYATLGTVISQTDTGLFSVFIDAFEKLKKDVFFFMTVGSSTTMDYQPENVYCASYVPMNHILPHIDGAIHQCGFSTHLGILTEGIPSVTIPVIFDQKENAARLDYAGCGIRIENDKLTLENISNAILKMLNDKEIYNNSKKFGKILKGYPGPDKGAELLEKMVNGKL